MPHTCHLVTPHTAPSQSFQDSLEMRIPANCLLVTCLTLALAAQQANAQFGGFDFFRPIQNFLKPVMRFFGGGPRFRDDGTQAPQATGRDALFPDDCGRDEDQGTGKLCFPDGKLCEESKSLCLIINKSQNCTTTKYPDIPAPRDFNARETKQIV